MNVSLIIDIYTSIQHTWYGDNWNTSIKHTSYSLKNKRSPNSTDTQNLHRQSSAPWFHKMLHMWGHKLRTNPPNSSQCDCTIFDEWFVEPLSSVNIKQLNGTSPKWSINIQYTIMEEKLTSACWRMGTKHDITDITIGETSWRTWNSYFKELPIRNYITIVKDLHALL